MKKNNLLFPILFSVIFTVIIYACKDETIITPPQPMNCNIDIPAFAVQLPCTVVYRAEATGNVTTSKITFRDNDGLQILNNPVLPFVFDRYILTTHDTVSMSVESVVTGGQLSVVVWTRSQSGSMISDTIKCGN